MTENDDIRKALHDHDRHAPSRRSLSQWERMSTDHRTSAARRRLRPLAVAAAVGILATAVVLVGIASKGSSKDPILGEGGDATSASSTVDETPMSTQRTDISYVPMPNTCGTVVREAIDSISEIGLSYTLVGDTGVKFDALNGSTSGPSSGHGTTGTSIRINAEPVQVIVDNGGRVIAVGALSAVASPPITVSAKSGGSLTYSNHPVLCDDASLQQIKRTSVSALLLFTTTSSENSQIVHYRSEAYPVLLAADQGGVAATRLK